jgi:hypothetical protein
MKRTSTVLLSTAVAVENDWRITRAPGWNCPCHPKGLFRPGRVACPPEPNVAFNSPKTGESGLQQRLLGAPSAALIDGPEHNALVHSAASVQQYLAAKEVQMIRHTSYSSDLAPADFFLFPKDEVQAGWPLTDPGELPEELRGGRPDHPPG